MGTDTGISRWKIVVLFAMIFLIGALAGTVATKFYVKKRLIGVVRGGGARRTSRIMRRLDRELDLTPQQRRKIKKILLQSQERLMRLRDSHIAQMREIFSETEREIGSCLNHQQRYQFQCMCKKMEGRWKRHGLMRMPRNMPPHREPRDMMHHPQPWRDGR